MPYIKQNRRDQLNHWRGELPKTPGELNYCVTQLVLAYLSLHGARYQTYNDIVGALESAKQEFYRREVAPYEDQKIIENGDIY